MPFVRARQDLSSDLEILYHGQTGPIGPIPREATYFKGHARYGLWRLLIHQGRCLDKVGDQSTFHWSKGQIRGLKDLEKIS